MSLPCAPHGRVGEILDTLARARCETQHMAESGRQVRLFSFDQNRLLHGSSAVRCCGELVKLIEPKHPGRPKIRAGDHPNSRKAAANGVGLSPSGNGAVKVWSFRWTETA